MSGPLWGQLSECSNVAAADREGVKSQNTAKLLCTVYIYLELPGTSISVV